MKWEDHRSWFLGSIAAAVVAFAAAVFSVVYAAYYNQTHHIAEWGSFWNRSKYPCSFVVCIGIGSLSGGVGVESMDSLATQAIH
jgi:hypothetical protein